MRRWEGRGAEKKEERGGGGGAERAVNCGVDGPVLAVL